MIGNEANIGGDYRAAAAPLDEHPPHALHRSQRRVLPEDPVISGTVASLETSRVLPRRASTPPSKHLLLIYQENHRGDGGIEQDAPRVKRAGDSAAFTSPFDICMHVGTVDENYVELRAAAVLTHGKTKVDVCQAIMSAFNRVGRHVGRRKPRPAGPVWLATSGALMGGLLPTRQTCRPYMGQQPMICAGGDSRLRSNENNYQYDE